MVPSDTVNGGGRSLEWLSGCPFWQCAEEGALDAAAMPPAEAGALLLAGGGLGFADWNTAGASEGGVAG